jgi:ubiquinol-cytochrome c reductase cytochrome b subunit
VPIIVPSTQPAAHGHLLAAAFNLNHPDHYLHWGFIIVSVANLVVIAVLIALFIAAMAVPFLRPRPVPSPEAPEAEPDRRSGAAAADGHTWTGAVRRVGLRFLPPAKLLPDHQPAYVASWAYVFGVGTLTALVVVVCSGLALAFEGPAWWHLSSAGHFVNSVHLWAVELFMGFMTVHLWFKFWMASWRGRRQATWMTGVLCFLIAIFEAFTGYISQTNFDSQWIAFEAKDGFASAGIGAFINPMNFGQALMLHISLIPAALLLLVAVHVLLVRVHGVAPPIDARPEDLGSGEPDLSDKATVAG